MYDGAGNRVSSTVGAGTVTTRYGALGLPQSSSGATSYLFDPLGRLTSEVGPT